MHAFHAKCTICVFLVAPLTVFCKGAPWQSSAGAKLDFISTQLKVAQHPSIDKLGNHASDGHKHKAVVHDTKVLFGHQDEANEIGLKTIPSGRFHVQDDVGGPEQQAHADAPTVLLRREPHSLVDQGVSRQDIESKQQRKNDAAANSTTDPDTTSCKSEPCCAAEGCIFPFTYKGQEYNECTKEDQDMYWCSKASTVTDESHWDVCLSKPADIDCDKIERPDNAGSAPLIGHPDQACRAPSPVDSAMQPSCAEGQVISDGKWCTPMCISSKMPFIRVKTVEEARACYGDSNANVSENFWGSKLCCSGGNFTPVSFFCVDDLFTMMDKDGNGEINEAEYENFRLKQAGLAKLAELEWEAVERIRREKEAESSADKPSQPPLDSTNPFVYYYVIIVSSLFVGVAITVVVYVLRLTIKEKQSPKPPPDTGGGNASVDGNGTAGAKDTAGPEDIAVPKKLVISTATDGQGLISDSTGDYDLVDGQEANGFPVWKSSEKEHYLFTGPAGKWLVASMAAGVDFGKDEGNISSSEPHGGQLPHLLAEGTWMQFNGTEFEGDANIKVTTPVEQ